MPLSYDPDDDASPDSVLGPLFLAYRDITGKAPIDKVAWPGIHLTASCFSDGVYDSSLFQKCFSNLLAAQFRRIVIDLYWDARNQEFSLCPVELPVVSSTTTSTTSQPTSFSTSLPVSTQASDRAKRQTDSQNATSSATSSASSSTIFGSNANSTTLAPSSTTSVRVPSSTAASGSILYTLGPYRCSNGLRITSITDILDNYFGDSRDSQLVKFHILVMNLHAAASSDRPDELASPPQAAEMPSGSALVGNIVEDQLSRFLYTKSGLVQDRKNLNGSWFAVRSEEYLPMTKYMNIQDNQNGGLSTDNGWPNEYFLTLTEYRRLLIGWGSISPEMEDYPFDADESIVFPPGYVDFERDYSAQSDGELSSGCFYSERSTDVPSVNNTWAFTTLGPEASDEELVKNLTACGIASHVNTTIGSQNANENATSYLRYTSSTIFGWAKGEPRNQSFSASADDGRDEKFRCVVMDSSDAYRGHWRVANCQNQNHAACRVDGQPFQWRISTNKADFTAAAELCRGEDSFDVPRTALENTYLYNQILSNADTADTEDSREILDAVWINLNSLDVDDCWVTTGPNGTCTYQQKTDDIRNREILIPTIAALIVLALTVLTILVKCTQNRRTSKHRRTGPGGWEYEGVPS